MELITIIGVGAIIAIFFFFVGFCCDKSCGFTYDSWELAKMKLEWEQKKLNDFYHPCSSFNYKMEMESNYQRGFFDGQNSLKYQPKTPDEKEVADLLNQSLKTTQQIAKELDVKLY